MAAACDVGIYYIRGECGFNKHHDTICGANINTKTNTTTHQ